MIDMNDMNSIGEADKSDISVEFYNDGWEQPYAATSCRSVLLGLPAVHIWKQPRFVWSTVTLKTTST